MSKYLASKTKPAPAEIGRRFYFREKELTPFSWNARVTLYRVMSESTPLIEEYTYLVYLLLSKTPQQMDALRSESSISAFRLEAGEWADKEGIFPGGPGWDELKKTAQEVLDAVKNAEAIEPVSSGGAPGK